MNPLQNVLQLCKINIMGNLQVLGAPLCSSTSPLHPASQEDAAVWHGLGVARVGCSWLRAMEPERGKGTRSWACWGRAVSSAGIPRYCW